MISRLEHRGLRFILYLTFSFSAPAASAVRVTAPETPQAVEVRVTQTTQSAPGQDAFNRIVELLKQSQEMLQAGQPDKAIPPAERALESAEKELGTENDVVAMCLTALAQAYELKEDYGRAGTYYQRALAIAERGGSGLEPFFVATLLNSVGRLHQSKGDYALAEPLFKRALAIQEKAQGPEDRDLATTLTNLGGLYQAKGDYERAEPLLRRALAIREKALGPESIDVIQSVKTMASLYADKGNYDQASIFLQRALTGLEKLLGADNPFLAPTLNDLALVYKQKGDYVGAERLYQRSIALLEKARGPEHASLATPLDNLANVFQLKGDYERAEALYKRALAIGEKSLGAEHPDVATTLSNLATLYQEQRDYERAEALFRRALTIKENALGPTHPDVATLLSNLAVLHYDKGDYEKAEPLARRVLVIKEKVFGPDHPDVARALNNVAALKEKVGDDKGAEAFYLRALAIYEKRLGPKHPDTTNLLQNLALLSAAKGDMSQALAYLTRSNEISEYNAALILTTGSEEQKRLYLATLFGETNFTVSLHLRSIPDNLVAARLALTTIFRRKGRALDAMTEQLAALRRHAAPQDRELLGQLSAARSQLATLVLEGAGKQSSEADHLAAAAKLEAEVQRLETAVSARSAEFRAQSQPVTIERIQEAIPPDAALIEIAYYYPFNAEAKTRNERYGAARYGAYVLRSKGEPRWVDLGDAGAIDGAANALREVLKSPQSTNAMLVGQALYGKVMRPILQLTGDTNRLLLSPDGELNLIPFGAFVDEQSRYLVEKYSITYLTSGRDLLRLQVHADSRQGAVIFADPLFEQGGAAGSQTAPASGPSGRRSAELTNVRFSPLPGTAAEARALGSFLPGVKVLTGAQATEAALKQVSGPSILHVATHGFFLPDRPQVDAAAGPGRGLVLSASAQSPSRRDENPLLRSGLALAGANQRRDQGGEDGLLTALEAAGIDLWGTKLVVLSACETGLGKTTIGGARERVSEGVYGLRRALVLAGAESQVMSLWQVSDEATRDLMVAYYRRLQAGEGRTEALRRVQLEMLRSTRQSQGGQRRGLQGELGRKAVKQDWRHPFYWASFIQSGEWRSLGGQDGRSK